MQTGDFNGDGKSDIAWLDTSGNVIDLADERLHGRKGARGGQRPHDLDRAGHQRRMMRCSRYP